MDCRPIAKTGCGLIENMAAAFFASLSTSSMLETHISYTELYLWYVNLFHTSEPVWRYNSKIICQEIAQNKRNFQDLRKLFLHQIKLSR